MNSEKQVVRPLYDIASDIQDDWMKIGRGVSIHARPYLTAMFRLGDIEEMYGADSARSVVIYFLSNAQGWRGVRAREIKFELKHILDGRK